MYDKEFKSNSSNDRSCCCLHYWWRITQAGDIRDHCYIERGRKGASALQIKEVQLLRTWMCHWLLFTVSKYKQRDDGSFSVGHVWTTRIWRWRLPFLSLKKLQYKNIAWPTEIRRDFFLILLAFVHLFSWIIDVRVWEGKKKERERGETVNRIILYRSSMYFSPFSMEEM